MSEHGAALQTYNTELVKCIEEMKFKRMDLQEIISKQEEQKRILEKHMKKLLDELNVLNRNLSQHLAMREKYDRAINETESGFKKILETSQVLLNSAQHEASRLENCNDKYDEMNRN